MQTTIVGRHCKNSSGSESLSIGSGTVLPDRVKSGRVLVYLLVLNYGRLGLESEKVWYHFMFVDLHSDSILTFI